jgi:hypothetical protein
MGCPDPEDGFRGSDTIALTIMMGGSSVLSAPIQLVTRERAAGSSGISARLRSAICSTDRAGTVAVHDSSRSLIILADDVLAVGPASFLQRPAHA